MKKQRVANVLGTAANRLKVNINVSDVTELVIPVKAIRKMAASGEIIMFLWALMLSH